MIALYIVALLLVIGITINLTGNLYVFIDIPSLLIVILPMIIGTVARHQWKDIKLYFKDKKIRSEISDSMATIAIFMGGFGTLMGLIMMLQNLSDPAAIGPAMSISFLSMLYGALIYLILYFTTNIED